MISEMFTDREWKRFIARFHAKISIDPETGCHIWTGATKSRGYGEVAIERQGIRRRIVAHRVAWEIAHGSAPGDLTLDHLCRNVRCVNPAHLEPVTRSENTFREHAAINGSEPGRECKRGHVGEYRRGPPHQKLCCLACVRERMRRSRSTAQDVER